MNRKKCLLIGTIVIMLMGGITLFSLNELRKERKAAELIEMETTTAKQIKNTFADVIEIKFAEEYYEDKITGFTDLMVTITTSYGVESTLDPSVYLHDESEKLTRYGVDPKLIEGVTKDKVKVIFSDKTERSL